MFDFVVIVCSLSFVLEIGIGVSGDGVDYAMCRETFVFLWRLTYLEWRWWGEIGLYFYFGVLNCLAFGK
jgi:hypothetical protein